MEIPIHVDYLSGRSVCEIIAGHEFTCAITLDGIAYTWGSNSRGQLAIATLSRDLRKIGLPRILDHILGSPVTAIFAGRYNIAFLIEEKNINKGTHLFNNWKRFVMFEERKIKERANYRFSLTVKEINNQKLQEKVKKERYDQYMANKFQPTFLPSTRSRYGTDHSINNLQNSRIRNHSESKTSKTDSNQSDLSLKKDSRSTSRAKRIKHKLKKKIVIANIETGILEPPPKKRYFIKKSTKEHIPPQSLDISQVMHIASEQGNIPNVPMASIDKETRRRSSDSSQHRNVPDLLNLSHSYPKPSGETVHLPPIKPNIS